MVEEGAGFGIPIAKYADTTLFCSTANLYLKHQSPQEAVLRKVFFLDVVSKKQIQNAFIDDGVYSVFHKSFERAYLGRAGLRPVFDWMMLLRRSLGVKTRFMQVACRGSIVVTYRCMPNKVEVHVDLSGLNRAGCEQVLLLNEQGAAAFPIYIDGNGTFFGRQIGAWNQVTAQSASFNGSCGVQFTLWNLPDTQLYRGREEVKDRFSWSGLTYALNPKTTTFRYTIGLRQLPAFYGVLG